MPLPIEIVDIIERIDTNVNVVLKNRERLRSLFDDSVGLSAKGLIPANDWTLLRDLWVQELIDANAEIEAAINNIQALQ